MTEVHIDVQTPGRRGRRQAVNLRIVNNPNGSSDEDTPTKDSYPASRISVALSSTSPTSKDSLGPESSRRQPFQRERRPTTERIIVAVTSDTENYVVVDLTGYTEARVIRERILSKLHIPDDLHSKFSIYRTELGGFAIGAALDDSQLLSDCQNFGDDRGSLKFLAQRSDAPVDGELDQTNTETTHSPVVPVHRHPPSPSHFRRQPSVSPDTSPVRLSSGPDGSDELDLIKIGHQNGSKYTGTLRAHCTQLLEQVVAEIKWGPGISEIVESLTLVFQAVERSRVNRQVHRSLIHDQWKLLRGRCVMVVHIASAQITSDPHRPFPALEHATDLLRDSLDAIAARAQHYNEMDQGTEFLQFEAISEEIKRLFGTLDSCLTVLFSYQADIAQSQWANEFRLVQEYELAILNQIRQKLLGGDNNPQNGTAGRVKPADKRTENLRSKGMSAGDMFECLLRHGCHDLTGKVDMKTISPHAVATGAYGDIWKGKLNDSTDIAIKIWSFRRFDEAPQKSLKGAMRELYNWSKADHRNIQKLLGVMMFKDRLGMVSEWMGNGNLQDYVRRHESCVEAARAVQHLHQEGMVHGDLKACNFLVSSDGVIKLTDFDHSIISCHSLVFSQTTTMGGGTMRWMAPELVMDEGEVELRSTQADVYALGMTILEIITGTFPYSECQTDAQIYYKLSDKTPPEQTKHFRNAKGKLLWKLLVRCWDHDPTLRPSADYVLNQLLIYTAVSPSEDAQPPSAALHQA